MFRVLNTQTGELAISLDYYTPEQLDKAFREPGKEGKLVCPTCRCPVVLRREFDEMPHFLHPKGSRCPHADEHLPLLKMRAALYRHLRREFGHGVTAEHDLPTGAPRSVDCWVESGGKKFGYWIFNGEIKSKAKRIALRSAIEREGAVCHFIFWDRFMCPKDSDANALTLSDTEQFAKVCTPFDVLNGENEGGSLHYLNVQDENAVLVTYRTLLKTAETEYFTGIKKRHVLADTEVCPQDGFLVHPGEKRHAEIIRTRKAREQFEEESNPDHPDAVRRREWELETRRSRRTNETVREIVARILQPRADLRSLELRREREALCEFCGVVTGDWIVYSGATGKCKCRTCYERVSAEKRKVLRPSTWKSDDGSVA